MLVIGTLDTKGVEIEFLAEAIAAQGAEALLLDSSTGTGQATSRFPVIPREEVARSAESTIDSIADLPRGEAVERMRAGVQKLTAALFVAGEVDAAICIGGAGTHLSGPAFQSLPIGFPKLVVSPLASGRRQLEPYVGLRDVAVMHSVADIAGINDITEKVFNTAAGYIVGAAAAHRDERSRGGADDGAPTVAVSMNGNTTIAMDLGRARLQKAGYAVVTFHANGVGGRALEAFVEEDRAAAVLDYTTTELGAGLVGGLMDAGPTRMETAGRKGIPQVLVPGCVDFITCGTLGRNRTGIPRAGDVRPQPGADPGPAARGRDVGAGRDLRRQGQPLDRPDLGPGAERGVLGLRCQGRAVLGPRGGRGLHQRPARQPRFPDPGPGDRGPHQRRGVRRRRRRRAAGPGRQRRRPKGPGLGMSVPWGILSTAAILEEMLPAFEQSEVAELRAIASRDLSRAEAHAAEHGIPVSHGSYEDLLADDSIECVYIALPNSLHGEWTRAAIEAGKHVLCEKPLTPTAEEARSLFELAEERGVVLMEAFMYRHHPKTRKLRELCESGEIGVPRVVRMKFHFKTAEPETDIRYDPELAGGALRDVGCYCVSMASYLAGAAPDTLTATARMSESGIDEQFSATLGFDNELLAVFDCGMYSPVDVGVEVLGTDGRAMVAMPWYAHLDPLSIELERDGETTEVPTPGPNAYRLEIDNVCAAARGEADPEISPEETLRNLTTIERLLEVAELDRSHAA